MKFVSPHWLWLIGLVPLMFLLFLQDEKKRRQAFSLLIHEKLWGQVAPEAKFESRIRKARVWSLASLLVILALARPQWGAHEEVVTVSGLDILVLVDISNSMEVEDVVPSRLKKAKHLLKSLIDRLHGDRVGIIPFAASNYLACPLTTDLDYVLEIAQSLSTKLISNQGTDVGAALQTAFKALERGAEQQTGEASGSHVIVLISDGEDHENAAIKAAEEIKPRGIKFYVIGVGTEKGGPIPIRDEGGNLGGYKKDRSGTSVISGFKPDALLQLAAVGGGKYWNATTGESEIDELITDVGALSRSDYAEKRFLVYEDRFQIPLFVAIMLLFFELGIPSKNIRTKIARAVQWAGIFILLMVQPHVAMASGMIEKQPTVQGYLQNEKGLKAFKEGKTEEAKQFFESAAGENPELPQNGFNRGIIQLTEGDQQSAQDSFSSSAQEALRRGDEQLATESLFNLGVTRAKKGEVTEAAKSFFAALELAKKSGNDVLEKDIRKNIELLLKEKQKQQQKENEKSDKKDQKGE
ncbi:MAG: VWA domain-containing protein, partial [Bdellovibrionota bacterium]